MTVSTFQLVRIVLAARALILVKPATISRVSRIASILKGVIVPLVAGVVSCDFNLFDN